MFSSSLSLSYVPFSVSFSLFFFCEKFVELINCIVFVERNFYVNDQTVAGSRVNATFQLNASHWKKESKKKKRIWIKSCVSHLKRSITV